MSLATIRVLATLYQAAALIWQISYYLLLQQFMVHFVSYFCIPYFKQPALNTIF